MLDWFFKFWSGGPPNGTEGQSSNQAARVSSNGQQIVDVLDMPEAAQGSSNTGHSKKPSDPITQWRCVIWGIIATQRLKGWGPEEAPEAYRDNAQALLPTTLNAPPENEVIEDRPAENNVQTQHQGSQAESTRNDEKKLEYLMVVRAALVQQLNSYGIVLTLLAAVTSVTILQPPGSFNGGHMQRHSLVACFLLFSSLSFLLACTGLLAVIVGSSSLFRPWFYPTPIRGMLHPALPSPPEKRDRDVVYDDISTLGKIVLDNLLRVKRLRIYLGLSLLLCMVAFVCGGFAILGPEKRNLYMAIGAIIASGGVLAVESGMTLTGPILRPKWVHIFQKFLTRMESGRSRQEATKNTFDKVRDAISRRSSSLSKISFSGN